MKEQEEEVKMITITLEEYDNLLMDSCFLTCLENAGVDNWNGFEVASEEFNEMFNEEDE